MDFFYRLPEEPEPESEKEARDAFWRDLGIRPPQNKPGGPPVEEDLFEPLFELRLPPNEAAQVFWLISEFSSWNQAYGRFLLELKRQMEESQ